MRISDHAVLRYMERKLGMDVEAVRREIAEECDTPGIRRSAAFAGRVPWRVRSDGMTYCVRNNTVTTCFCRKASGGRV